jgi:RNA polymerase sigma-70 factor (ECF subfamily)
MSPATQSTIPYALPARARNAEDLQLLRQVAAHQSQAFETLYHRYVPHLHRFLRRRLPQPELVDEVCNEVMLVVWQQAERFQPHACLSTWIFGIAKRQAHKAWAQLARQQAVPQNAPEAPAMLPDPEGLLVAQERSRGIAQALTQLPPPQRAVVEAVYYQAASHAAIAARLECAVPTVKTRLAQARRRLRASLAQDG